RHTSAGPFDGTGIFPSPAPEHRLLVPLPEALYAFGDGDLGVVIQEAAGLGDVGIGVGDVGVGRRGRHQVGRASGEFLDPAHEVGQQDRLTPAQVDDLVAQGVVGRGHDALD